MSEDLKISGDGPLQDSDRLHSRILIIMGSVALVGTIVSAAGISIRFGLGFLLGGVLSLANYYWIKRITKKFFERAVKGESVGTMGIRFALRYFVIGLLLLIVYLTGIVPIIAVLLGLAGFAFAVVVEGLFSIFSPVKG